MNCCILIAGMPASGKTTFACHLAKETGLPMLSKDRVKEILYDSLGFHCRDEKVAMGKAATSLLYYYAESLMQAGRSFILENNFEDVSKPRLQSLLQAYAYRPVTVRFGGDVRVIYERYIRRDAQPDRHRGHVVNAEYPEPPGAPLLAAPLTLEAFAVGVEQRGIADFTLGGAELYVDTTHFESVRYPDIVDKIRRMMGEPPVWQPEG